VETKRTETKRDFTLGSSLWIGEDIALNFRP